MTHPAEDRLQDYLDDLLCREERAELEAHLVSCAACTAHVRDARALQAALHSLPRSIEPPAHVLAEIHARLDATGGAPPARPRRWFQAAFTPLAAAALVLVVASALFAWYLKSRGAPAAAVADARPPVVRQVLAAERSYLDAAAELEALLATAGDRLTPETRAVLQHNLGVIEQALTESRAALDREPDNVLVAELLRAAHEQKLTLLRRATRVTGGT